MASLAEDRERVVAALALNWVAGYVDVIGWILFLGLYTANMTGNLVAIGRSATQGSAADMLRSSVPIAGFFAGLFCAALWTRGRTRRAWTPLALEAALLAAIGFVPGKLPLWGAAVLAFAMGIQNATLTRAGDLHVRTTHVTGTISRLAESLAQLLRRGRRQARRHVWFLSALLVAYLGGAICGTVAVTALGNHALLIPAALAGCLVLLLREAFQLRPQEQA